MARQLRINYPGAFCHITSRGSEGRPSRDVKQYLCYRYTSVRLKKIGEQFKISELAVSHAVSRVSKTIAKGKKSAKKIDRLINKLNHSRFKT
jgi:chromosomal replication initiation ATPase DnaA